MCKEMQTILVKNMVCKKCFRIIQAELKKIDVESDLVKLGELLVIYSEDEVSLNVIRNTLEKNGFEFLSEREIVLLKEIKDFILNSINNQKLDRINQYNIAILMEKEFKIKFHLLNNLFSSIENISIDYFIRYQKVEKAKELLKYEGLSLEEISPILGYTSVQHLTRDFKTITGFTATKFRHIIDKK
jgi:AraC-like DNA-binding protein